MIRLNSPQLNPIYAVCLLSFTYKVALVISLFNVDFTVYTS